MRIEVIDTARGRRFYWHGLGSDHQSWVLLLPRIHSQEQLVIERDGEIIYAGALGTDSFGPITCFSIARPQLLGRHHPKLYAALFHAGDILRIVPNVEAGVPQQHFDAWFWYQLIGAGLASESPYFVSYRALEPAA